MRRKTTILVSGILMCLMSCTPKATNKDVTLAGLVGPVVIKPYAKVKIK